MFALACFACVCCFALLARGCSTAAAVVALALSIGCSTAAAGDVGDLKTLSFAAMQSRSIAAAPCVATSPAGETLDCRAMARRQPEVSSAATADQPVSFATMARRAVVKPSLVPSPPPKPTPPSNPQPIAQTGLRYWHTDGLWRDHPQPGLAYNLASSRKTRECVGGQCRLR